MVLVLAVLAAAGCALALTAAFVRGAGPAMLDHPNERSLHEVPVPRTGGLAIVAGIVAGHGVVAATAGLAGTVPSLAACAALVLAVSVADDWRHVAAWLRMLVHLAAAAGLVAWAPLPAHLVLPGDVRVALPAPVLAVFWVLFVVWMTNAYNFMDGMDGFAGGMGLIGFGVLAVLAARGGGAHLAVSAAVLAAACGGFLVFNFPPARIFMGDAGSSVLGFLAAGLALDADAAGVFPLWLAVLAFAPFLVDATVTLLRRAFAGERVWQAHRSHFYQRLVRLGWGHRRTTLCEYLLMVAGGATAIALLDASAPVQQAAACAWVLIYAMLMVQVTALERRRERHGSDPNP